MCKFCNFKFCHNRRDSFWSTFVNSLTMQIRHNFFFCLLFGGWHFCKITAHCDTNCTVIVSGKENNSWFSSFLVMYVSYSSYWILLLSKFCPTICPTICLTSCQKIWPNICPKICSKICPNICPKLSKTLTKYLSKHLSKNLSNNLSNHLSNHLSKKSVRTSVQKSIQKSVQKFVQISVQNLSKKKS